MMLKFPNTPVRCELQIGSNAIIHFLIVGSDALIESADVSQQLGLIWQH